MKKNNPKTWALTCLILSLAGIALFMTGVIKNQYEAMWMIMVGIMLFATFAICFGMFIKQSAKLDRMFEGKDILAHWVYMDGNDHAEKEKKARFKNNVMLMTFVSACFIIFTALFVLFGFKNADDAYFFVSLIAGILALLWAAAMLSPVFAAHKMKTSAKEAYLSREGAWVMGEYYFWKAPFMRLKNIGLYTKNNTIAYIEIVIETLRRTGWQPNTVRIPVPREESDTAKKAVNEIMFSNGL